jgi:predicted cupin superfamily sugar epimerase
MQTANYWIEKLNLKQHPEGGFYSETYRSNETISKDALPDRFTSDHSFGTAIYFLLRSEDVSAFHRLKSDELWFFHLGGSVEVVFLTDNGTQSYILGADFEKGEYLQLIIPANTWFGARVLTADSFVLVSCTVCPGFEFQDFELAKKEDLLVEFPDCSEVIGRF